MKILNLDFFFYKDELLSAADISIQMVNTQNTSDLNILCS